MNHPELIDAFDKIARVVERDDSRFQYIDKELDTLRQILSQHQNTIDGLVSLLEAKNSFDRAALVRLSQVQRSQPNSNTSVEEPLRLQQVSPRQ